MEKITNAQTAALTGWVNCSTYFAVADNCIVGTIQIRHTLNDFLLNFGGHIGYSIRPSERRKGYGTRMLALALNKCRGLGLDKVLITCNDKNEASAKTIVKNGGVLEDKRIERDGGIVRRYWIVL